MGRKSRSMLINILTIVFLLIFPISAIGGTTRELAEDEMIKPYTDEGGNSHVTQPTIYFLYLKVHNIPSIGRMNLWWDETSKAGTTPCLFTIKSKPDQEVQVSWTFNCTARITDKDEVFDIVRISVDFLEIVAIAKRNRTTESIEMLDINADVTEVEIIDGVVKEVPLRIQKKRKEDREEDDTSFR